MQNIRGKITLYTNLYGWVKLKRWNKAEGFYIEFISNTEPPSYKVYSRGKSLKECIKNLSKKSPFSLQELFSVKIADEIIETFELTEEDIAYIQDVGDKADF